MHDPARRLADIVEAAGDRSSEGDELARFASDPGLRIHLDPARLNVLAPLVVRPGMRVIELGAGAGLLTRALAETGARVTAIEPDPELAAIATTRVTGLPAARIVAADPEVAAGLPGDASLVILAVPLTGSGLAGSIPGRLAALIARAAAHLAPDGLLLVTCDQPAARRALVGAAHDPVQDAADEDDGSEEPAPRARLAAALEAAGLDAQRWYGAFPDGVAPRVLVAEALLADPSGSALTVAFARDPGGSPEAGVRLARDPSTALAAQLRAGAGLAAAPGLLVLAARSPVALEAHQASGALFLRSSGARGRAWRRARVLEATGNGWRLRPQTPGTDVRDGPLRARDREEAVVVGRNGEDLLVEALVASGISSARTRAVLGAWWRAAAREMAAPDADGGWQFDVGLRNFIVDVSGNWHHVDRELTLDAPPRPDVMVWRAIAWALIERIRPLGDLPGMPPGTTVRGACLRTVAAAGLPARADTEVAWLAFEPDLQARLRPSIEDPMQERAALTWLLDRQIVLAATTLEEDLEEDRGEDREADDGLDGVDDLDRDADLDGDAGPDPGEVRLGPARDPDAPLPADDAPADVTTSGAGRAVMMTAIEGRSGTATAGAGAIDRPGAGRVQPALDVRTVSRSGWRWLDLGDPAWPAFLEGVRHDVFHLPASVRVMAATEPHSRAGALLVEHPAGSLLAPLLLRSLDGSPGAPPGSTDAMSPRVYASPLLRPAPGQTSPEAAAVVVAAFRAALREAGVVAAFVRQHPLLPLPDPPLGTGETIAQADGSVALDLSLGREALRGAFRANHRRDLADAARQGYRARIDEGWERLDEVVAAYAATMDRLGAAPHLRHGRAHFAALRDALGERARLCVVEQGDELGCAVLVSIEDGIVEYLYAATPDAHIHASPSKVAIAFLVDWAIERGARWFELGGTGPSDGGLARFKAGFSGVPAPVLIWQLITDPDAYAALCAAAGVAMPAEEGWFPAYRRPR